MNNVTMDISGQPVPSQPEKVQSIDDLIKKVRAYHSGADTEFLSRAYYFASEAHGLAKRSEGKPYMTHPLEVASILADMKMDVATISAGLLHDTVEDTHVTPEDIKKRFGYELAFLVEGLTKLAKVEYKSKELAQAESFRKMILSMSEDIRVILIKFADRLHNMRTLEFLSDERRQRIATETLDIYAPLANRLGIGWLKTELEDLSFRYAMPKVYQEIAEKVEKRREVQEKYISDLVAIVKQKLIEEVLPGMVMGRVKHFYGIYQKMQHQGIPFEMVHDVLGIRIITDSNPNCYAIIGLVHSLWTPIPGKFKDYIGVPKSNMYQSLHTTVIGPGGERVEFQVRTEEMDSIAEGGIAAHWRYKEKGGLRDKDNKYISWLRDVIQQQLEEKDPIAFMEAVKSEVLPEMIYVFTPEGDIKELPQNSTPVDFAYAIHTAVGNQCVGARINGKMVPLRHALESGNTVEIMTSPGHKPSRDWLKFVVTTRAKTRIKQWLKGEERKQGVDLGLRLMEDDLRKHSLSPSIAHSPEMEEIAHVFKVGSADELLAAVGFGKITPLQVIRRLRPDLDHTARAEPELHQHKPREKEQKGIIITGIDGVLYHTSKCCYPVPGDALVGFITRGKGVAVHRRDCQNFQSTAVDEARVIDVQWTPAPDSLAYARVRVDSADRAGVLAEISSIVSAANINISHLEAITSRQDRRARITCILEVRDRNQLSGIMTKLSQIQGVHRIARY